MSDNEELAALKLRVAQLELERAAKPQSPEDREREVAAYRDQVHQARERRANAMTWASPEQLRAMAEASGGPGAIHDIWSHGTVQTPSGAGTSGQVTGVRVGGGPTGIPGDGTGWAREIPLGPSHHQRYVDAQLDAADARDRAERIEAERRRKGG
jgi:hypothetical protein